MLVKCSLLIITTYSPTNSNDYTTSKCVGVYSFYSCLSRSYENTDIVTCTITIIIMYVGGTPASAIRIIVYNI